VKITAAAVVAAQQEALLAQMLEAQAHRA